MTITEFLLARITEDEEAAGRGRSHPDRETFARDNYGYLWVQPLRVLAECEAKRLAINAAWNDHERIEGEWGTCKSIEQMDALGDVPEVVTALTSVYADHPDYREEWRA